MKVYPAKQADVVRCSQRDELFVQQLENDFSYILRLLDAKYVHSLRALPPVAANVFYYGFTSASKLQTLGEEYAGILRIRGDNRIPNNLIQICWIALHIGGEPILNNLLSTIKTSTSRSTSVTKEAKSSILTFISLLQNNKLLFGKLHRALFFIFGTYYYLSNRVTGISYILLREWMQDSAYSQSFKVLGGVSLVYVIYIFTMEIALRRTPIEIVRSSSDQPKSEKMCPLCAEPRKNASATPCGHQFCWTCIHDSLKYQQACPICRERVNPSRVILLQNFV